LTQRRLTEVFARAKTVGFDDTSRLVFFSDCHRGDSSRADAFAANEALFLHALDQYDQAGFTYVEVGDGDELWQNRSLKPIRRAHGRTYDRLHEFDRAGRLHMLLGNHDIQHPYRTQVNKDGIVADEGLILQHRKSGQQVFVVHGHQADLRGDRFLPLSKFTVRHLWRRTLILGLAKGTLWMKDLQDRHRLERYIVSKIQAAKLHIEQRIANWARDNRQIILCGHTHRPTSAQQGMPPYFNTGNCVSPGQITGIEIQDGAISSVRWSVNGRVKREVLSAPQPLSLFA
jgi:UDP-2,3-diacylglucosamine pyrophosphatase LpxH